MDNKKDERTLQEMLKTLDEQIRALESEDISLEDSFGIYEQGMKLIKECNDKIDRVEKKVLELNADGTLQEME
ncbi:MAG: exodeoxyribonuclease VII small subunit [Lachnospiraceae bacterium]|nr:exodeoxyribonuclease VII small subunit [Lachnospiraceae bacterium]